MCEWMSDRQRAKEREMMSSDCMKLAIKRDKWAQYKVCLWCREEFLVIFNSSQKKKKVMMLRREKSESETFTLVFLSAAASVDAQ